VGAVVLPLNLFSMINGFNKKTLDSRPFIKHC